MKPFCLAPMAGINSTAFRLLCKENGADIIYTQMYDVNLLCTKTKEEVKKLLNIKKEEHPVVIQLIGSNLKKFRQTIPLVEGLAEEININVGCIEKRYLEHDCGAALLKDPEELGYLVKRIVACTKKPISVKIRIGWDGQSLNAVKVCNILEDNGVKKIIIHGRTAMQKYAGKSNWAIMKQVKEKSSIPIIANGDVKSYQDGLDLLERTGCDEVMVGREAKYAPWIFSNKQLTKDDIIKQILRYIELYETYENRCSVSEVYDQVFRMTRDIETTINKRDVKECASIAEIKQFISGLNS